MYLKKYKIHFVGIGGNGMSSLANVLAKLGHNVSGSDIFYSSSLKKLEELKCNIHIGHKKKYVEDVDLVVISSAIHSKNVEVRNAIFLNIPIIKRSIFLCKLMEGKFSIAISGMHGKTSTTGLILNVFIENKSMPTVIAGGTINIINSNSILGKSKYVIVEIDESDGFIISYKATISIINNIDNDHLDFYGTKEYIRKAFFELANKIPLYGVLIVCFDNIENKKIISHLSKKIVTFAINGRADLKAINVISKNMFSKFNVYFLGNNIGKIKLNLLGLYNIYNALAAIVVGLYLNVSLSVIQKAMKKELGIKRRMDLLVDTKKLIIIDDYAHHPTEILSVLNTIKIIWPNRRKIVIFQPHRYSRTKMLFEKFIDSFCLSDIILFVPIYSSGENFNRYSVKSKKLYLIIKKNFYLKVLYFSNFFNCIKQLNNILNKGDLLVTLGAGNVNQISKILLEEINNNDK